MLSVKNVVKEYANGVKANDNINLTVNSGEIVGLLGPNGAGKTTLVSQIIGSITIGGIVLLINLVKRENCVPYSHNHRFL
ncbi:ATP-binding cassette domain-containing protein [Gracilibacillus sp. S3-1-1]|uniref:ATP-binding cassette domain-containing protein n=1 Tax=Gracilibacillus pellucidus TaxID=3095368 RepID=A0ACC6M3M8_9BACI|nr:ATP-binding cassette domain-containing protein [Gracilibacillus sp. S3-1-1]MDX8045564.1 ATP-binding cassette domain-containing protein [Gracilibacillus sp. S3-1-1]